MGWGGEGGSCTLMDGGMMIDGWILDGYLIHKGASWRGQPIPCGKRQNYATLRVRGTKPSNTPLLFQHHHCHQEKLF